MLNGHKLHTFGLCERPSDVSYFSRIFERPLPRLNRVKTYFFPPSKDNDLAWSELVDLQLPTDLPLRLPDLRDATLPWSSNIPTGLGELHLDYRDCDPTVEMSEDRLLGILDVSPQLERLELLELMLARDDPPRHAYTRIVQLLRLVFLEFDTPAASVACILAHINIPAVASLEIRSQIRAWEAE
jgi:hypothetical protein